MPEVKCALASSRCAESTGALKESSEFHLIVNCLLDRAYPDGRDDRLTSFSQILGLTTVTRASEMSAMALEGRQLTHESAPKAERESRSERRGFDAVNNARHTRGEQTIEIVRAPRNPTLRVPSGCVQRARPPEPVPRAV